MSSERHGSNRTQQSPDAEGRGHIADRLSAPVEHLKRRDHDQNVQAAADECLREDQGNDEANARHARNRAETCRKQLPRALAGRDEADPALDPDSRDKDRGHEKRTRAGGEHHPDIDQRDEQPGEQRPDERAEALDRGGGAIRSNELFGSTRERWQQRLERRPDERDGEPEQRREGEHERLDVGIERGGRCAERESGDEHEGEQETLTGEAVAHRGCERRDDCGRQQTDEPREADRRRASDVVGIDAEGDEVRPFRRNCRAPRQLGAPHIRVPKS